MDKTPANSNLVNTFPDRTLISQDNLPHIPYFTFLCKHNQTLWPVGLIVC